MLETGSESGGLYGGKSELGETLNPDDERQARYPQDKNAYDEQKDYYDLWSVEKHRAPLRKDKFALSALHEVLVICAHGDPKQRCLTIEPDVTPLPVSKQ